MTESYEQDNNNYNEQTPHELNPEIVRAKLISVAEEWMPQLPELLGNMKGEDMMSKMLLNTFRPFLPRLEDGLINAIDSAEPENILRLVQFVEDTARWLKED